MRSPMSADVASVQPASREHGPSRRRGEREGSGDGINRGLSAVRLRRVKKILEPALCCSAGVQPQDTLSGGSVRYLPCWLRLTFPSTALQSFPVTPLPTLRPSAAQTETPPCRAVSPEVQSKCPAQDLPRRQRKGTRVSQRVPQL